MKRIIESGLAWRIVDLMSSAIIVLTVGVALTLMIGGVAASLDA
jgi:hypothetical protein